MESVQGKAKKKIVQQFFFPKGPKPNDVECDKKKSGHVVIKLKMS